MKTMKMGCQGRCGKIVKAPVNGLVERRRCNCPCRRKQGHRGYHYCCEKHARGTHQKSADFVKGDAGSEQEPVGAGGEPASGSGGRRESAPLRSRSPPGADPGGSAGSQKTDWNTATEDADKSQHTIQNEGTKTYWACQCIGPPCRGPRGTPRGHENCAACRAILASGGSDTVGDVGSANSSNATSAYRKGPTTRRRGPTRVSACAVSY